MPDKKVFTDENGNPLSDKKFVDYEGKPLDTPALKTHNQGMGKPTSAEASQYVERQPNFREAIGKDVPSAIAMGASMGGPISGAAGSFIGQGMREASPELFGGPEGGNVGTDLLMNSALPGLLGGLNKLAAGPRAYIAEKLASRFGQKLPQVKNLMEANQQFNTGEKAAFDSTQRKAELNFRSKVFGKDNPSVYNPEVKTPEGFTPSSFNAPEPNLDEVKKILSMASAKSDKNSLARYTKKGLLLSLPTYAATRLVGAGPTAAIGGTILLGEQAIKQATKDPQIAQLLIKAIKTPGADKQSGLIGTTLLNAIRGTTVTLINADGDEQPAMVDNDGKLVYKR